MKNNCVLTNTKKEEFLVLEKIKKLPCIDFLACVEIHDNDENFTKELLQLWYQQCDSTKQLIMDSYQRFDIIQLRHELHRCLGGLSYLQLPRLNIALEIFQQLINKKFKDVKKMELIYYTALDAFTAFKETYEQAQWLRMFAKQD